MKARTQLGIVATVLAGVALMVLWVVLSAPTGPVARVRVVDAAGKPIAGAMITPTGLRTKSGPYRANWYAWKAMERSDLPVTPVKTGRDGYASIDYPKYVFEKIETGVITFNVGHPDFVPENPEREVSTKPPAGSPLRLWGTYLMDRIQHHDLVTQVDPVVLRPGAILRVTTAKDSATPKNDRLFVQVSGSWEEGTNFWTRPEPGVIQTRRLGAGAHTMRAVQFDDAGRGWFSDCVNIDAVAGRTNDVVVKLTRGVSLRGKLDAAVPRPVKDGRLIAHVWPQGALPQNSPPQWHAWTNIQEDGSFEISGLPQGDLEVVAICKGFVSTNGPGKTGMHYPQKHVLGTNDLIIDIGMQPTARLEVHLTDKQGKPVKGAKVGAWPNVRYGEWAAVVLGGDCYNTSDPMLSKSGRTFSMWSHLVPDFNGTSDESGLVVLANLPADVKEIAVDHPELALPAVVDRFGGKRREANVKLTAGVTNETWIQLEPKDAAPIRHY